MARLPMYKVRPIAGLCHSAKVRLPAWLRRGEQNDNALPWSGIRAVEQGISINAATDQKQIFGRPSARSAFQPRPNSCTLAGSRSPLRAPVVLALASRNILQIHARTAGRLCESRYKTLGLRPGPQGGALRHNAERSVRVFDATS